MEKSDEEGIKTILMLMVGYFGVFYHRREPSESRVVGEINYEKIYCFRSTVERQRNIYTKYDKKKRRIFFVVSLLIELPEI